MQNLENLKKHYDKVGWVVHKKLFDENQISIVKKLIDGFLSSQLKRYSSKTKSLNFVNDSDTTDLNNILTRDASKNMYESRPFSEKLRQSIPLYGNERLFSKNILDVDLLGTDDSLFSDTTTIVGVQRVIVDEGSMV